MPNNRSAENFYTKILDIISKNKIPFMIGGGFAIFKYTGFKRPTKDLDIFCKAGDYPRILTILEKANIRVRILDERWLAQALENKTQVDFLFSSPNYLVTVDDSWLEHATDSELFGHKVKMIPQEELIWCKAYVQDRNRFDGADINHVILSSGKNLNWKRLLMRMENHWEILLSLILTFRFVYPSERDVVPKWLLEELDNRLKYQIKNPTPRDKICRGPLLSRTQYKFDITELGFETIT